MRCKYFISYVSTVGGTSIFGSVAVNRPKPINSTDELSTIAREIEENNNYPTYSVVILNFQRF